MAGSVCYINTLLEEKGGFNFDNHFRNTNLLKYENEVAFSKKQKNLSIAETDQKSILLRTRKTGTTICGIITKDGVILGADTRATEGPIIAIKNCEKLHQLTETIFIAGAGVSADLHHVGSMMKSRLELLRLTTKRQPKVIAAVTMFQQYLFNYQGYITCAIVMGGIDCEGSHLYKIFPHGSCDKLPFCAMGSGSLNALAVLESSYKDNMTLEEGKSLVGSAIMSGVTNDLGSGGNVDLAIIPFDSKYTITAKCNSHIIRGFHLFHQRQFFPANPPKFPPGTTKVLHEQIQELKKLIIVENNTTDSDIEML